MSFLRNKLFWTSATIVFSVAVIVSCTKSDTVLGTTTPTISETDLVSVFAATAPAIDGTIDASWDNSPKLQFSTAAPEVTGDVFRGYTGNVIPSVTLRSMYDASNIYFLAEWIDPTESLKREPWYWDTVTKKWAQESGNKTFSSTGNVTRAAFYEDKMAMLWNVNNSVAGWATSTCYKSCHTGLPATDGSSKHFTNFSTEKIDMWHWKAVRGGLNGAFQVEDQFQDNTYPNGRKSDAGAAANSNNVQSLNVTGSSPAVSVSVPKYVIKDKTNYYWIESAEFTAGTAKTITEVNSNGVLTLSDGSTIDPNTGNDYKRNGGDIGAKAIPGMYINSAGYTESRGDISCKAVYTGTGWILEFKRLLKTTDAVNDIDFSSLSDQNFGFAIFENAQIAHSIKPGLLLKFKK